MSKRTDVTYLFVLDFPLGFVYRRRKWLDSFWEPNAHKIVIFLIFLWWIRFRSFLCPPSLSISVPQTESAWFCHENERWWQRQLSSFDTWHEYWIHSYEFVVGDFTVDVDWACGRPRFWLVIHRKNHLRKDIANTRREVPRTTPHSLLPFYYYWSVKVWCVRR